MNIEINCKSFTAIRDEEDIKIYLSEVSREDLKDMITEKFSLLEITKIFADEFVKENGEIENERN